MYKDPEQQRKAQREWATRNRESLTLGKTRIRKRNAEYVRIKKNAPCVDCGSQYHHAAMDFDHLPGAAKVAKVAALVNQAVSLKKIDAEIAKCELVCSNCHRIRTYQRDPNAYTR